MANGNGEGRDSKGRFAEGHSGNPNGAPKDGESWSGIIKELSGKTSEELIAMVGGSSTEFGKRMKGLPKKVQIKYVVVLNSLITMAGRTSGRYDKPFNASLYGETINRVEGKVPDKLLAGFSRVPVEDYEQMMGEIYNHAPKKG